MTRRRRTDEDDVEIRVGPPQLDASIYEPCAHAWTACTKCVNERMRAIYPPTPGTSDAK